MLSGLIDWLAVWPPELAVTLIGFLPIAEIRGAVPVGITIYHLSAAATLWWAFLGNFSASLFVLGVLPLLTTLGKRFTLLNNTLERIFLHTRTRWFRKHQRFGVWALLIFVAIPLPFTGAWTGSVAAWLFGIPLKRALPLIAAGILISGFIVYLITVSGVSILSFLRA